MQFEVVLGIKVSDQSAARVLDSVVAFHPSDASNAQSFTVVGVDDGELGEDRTYSLMVYLVTSDDLLYQQAYGETHQEFTLTNVESKRVPQLTPQRVLLTMCTVTFFPAVRSLRTPATRRGISCCRHGQPDRA